MGAILKFLLIGLLIIWLLHSPAIRGRKQAAKKPAQPPAAKPPESMVACAHCAVMLPASEACLDAAGRPYCSGAHRDLASGAR